MVDYFNAGERTGKDGGSNHSVLLLRFDYSIPFRVEARYEFGHRDSLAAANCFGSLTPPANSTAVLSEPPLNRPPRNTDLSTNLVTRTPLVPVLPPKVCGRKATRRPPVLIERRGVRSCLVWPCHFIYLSGVVASFHQYTPVQCANPSYVVENQIAPLAAPTGSVGPSYTS